MNLGAYTLIRKIAEGGVADIYLAKTKSVGGKDAYLVCKCLRRALTQDTDFLTSAINEAQYTVRLRHPNILEVFDLCLVQGQTFLTMEYMDAQDFHKLIRGMPEHGASSVPYPFAIYAVAQAALGLHAAHELTDAYGHPLNLVHRDISPENILFNRDGDVKIADFGIAKTSQMLDVTPPDVIKGKFNYMSPEQAWGDRPDRRSDIFSLAAVLYEATTGHAFYPAQSVADTITRARMTLFDKPSELVPDYPSDLEAVLLKALDIDKKLRFPTALEFKYALDDVAKRHAWNIRRQTWIDFLRQHVDFPDAPLPLLHADNIQLDAQSILRPLDEDPNATDQVNPDELLTILEKTAAATPAPVPRKAHKDDTDSEPAPVRTPFKPTRRGIARIVCTMVIYILIILVCILVMVFL